MCVCVCVCCIYFFIHISFEVGEGVLVPFLSSLFVVDFHILCMI